jgi:DNA-binding winged helix-turn-helix (wHTH) protein
MDPEIAKYYEFDIFRLDPIQKLLTVGAEHVRLSPKTFELLLFLVRNPNQVINKETLLREVWRDSYVEEANLAVQISNLRRIFSSAPDNSVSIDTFPKVGYRFNANVRPVWEREPVQQSSTVSPLIENDVSRNDGPLAGARNGFRLRPVMLGLLSAVALGVLFFGFVVRPRNVPPTIERVRGTEQSSALAISPNGEYIAHAVSKAGKRTLMMTHIGSGSSVVLQPADEALYWGLTFSKEGNFLYFVKDVDGRRSLYRIPILGGNVVQVLENVGPKVSFAPAGDRFCFVTRDGGGTAIVITNTDGSGESILSKRMMPQFYSESEIAWSPDGKTIAILAGDQNTGSQLTDIDTITGEERSISDSKWAGGDGLDWLGDGSGLVAGLFDKDNSATQVWFIPFPGGEPRRITNDVENYGSIGVSADGNTILAGQFKDESSLWLQSASDPMNSKPVSNEKHHLYKWVRWTGDGKLIYASSIGEHRDVYVMDKDGTNERQITENARNNVMPVTTPE